MGISIRLPEGTYSCIAPRSGLAWKHGLSVGAGVIDQDYSGDIWVLLFNHGNTTVTINKGDRVAQLIPEKYSNASLKEVNQIPTTEHRDMGFGSTGIADLYSMDEDLVEIYAVDIGAIDLMPHATEEMLKWMIPEEYHDFIDLADPEGPL